MSHQLTIEFEGIKLDGHELRNSVTIETEVKTVEGIRPTYEMIIENFEGSR